MTKVFISDRILSVLGELGPMTGQEIANELQLARNIVATALQRLQQDCRGRVRCVRIHGYNYDDTPNGHRLRAVFALGDKQDAKRPVIPRSKRTRRYNTKKAAPNSIFAGTKRVQKVLSQQG